MSRPDTEHDPTAALRLLWGQSPPPGARGPKRGLTVPAITDAAIDIAEADGLSAVTMRAVAERLEVGTASLYTYVPGRPELLALMLDRMIGDATLPHTLPGDWRDRLTAMAREDWEAFRSHPWTLALVAAQPPLLGPNLLRWFESALGVLDETGLDLAARWWVLEVIDSYVRGSARSAAETPTANSQWGRTQGTFLSEHVDFAQYPQFAQMIIGADISDHEAQFSFGLERLLDGIESYLDQTR